ncbi:MAG: hypothetical protein ABEN55_09860, partial [Bradymonadaceae bacterium]
MSEEIEQTDRDELPEIGREELVRRVIYSLFGPAARVATEAGLPLKEVTSFLEMACYHHLKSASMTLREAADVLDISRRKVAQLSKRLKQNFFDPER